MFQDFEEGERAERKADAFNEAVSAVRTPTGEEHNIDQAMVYWTTAIDCYRRAADLGHVGASVALAELYRCV